MLAIYFSGTGNTKYIAELFAKRMGAKCRSVEDDVDFDAEIRAADVVAVCYPIYGSRVPLIMREFIAKNIEAFRAKKLAVFVTQMVFSGDGARVLCDLFPQKHVKIIYAEHFFMPNNICNFKLFRRPSKKSVRKRLNTADKKMERVCRDIREGVVKKRGFSAISRLLGKLQGMAWQGNSQNADAAPNTMEYKAKHGVRIDGSCTACGLCVKYCPAKNLHAQGGKITHKNNCTVCYRCVNLCPQRAVTVFIHAKPRWQYQLDEGR